MTDQQLRAIASYYGAPYSFDHYERNTNKPDWPYEWQRIVGKPENMFTALLLCRIGDYREEVAKNFKLHLRRLESLTDEEVRECARRFGCDAIVETVKVLRWPKHFQVSYFGLGYNGAIDLNEPLNPIPIADFASLIAYLQSIHVYVPGMIEEQFVIVA